MVEFDAFNVACGSGYLYLYAANTLIGRYCDNIPTNVFSFVNLNITSSSSRPQPGLQELDSPLPTGLVSSRADDELCYWLEVEVDV